MSVRRPLLIISVVLIALLFVMTGRQTETLHTLVSTDPLFYSPYLDAEKLEESVTSLLEAERALNETMKANYNESLSPQEGHLQNAFEEIRLFPRTYLILLPEAIQKTQTFIDVPTRLNAFLMNRAVTRAARAYKHETNLFAELTLRSFAHVGTKSFTVRFLGSEVSKDQIIDDVRLLQKNGEALVQEARMRSQCLFGLPCPDQRPFTLSYVPQPPDEILSKPTLSVDVLSSGYGNAPFSEPYVIQSSCFPDRYTVMHLIEEPNRVPIKNAHQSYYTDHNYYIEEGFTGSYHQVFIDNGMRYDYQAEWADYICPDLRYWGDITTIDYLNTELGLDEITSSYDLYALYQKLKEDDGDSKLRRLIENKLVALPELLPNITRNLLIFESILAFGGNNPPSRFLIAQRSNYGFLYGPSSHSIWRLDEELEYVTRANLPSGPSYVTYSELQKEYSDEEIALFHQDRWELLE